MTRLQGDHDLAVSGENLLSARYLIGHGAQAAQREKDGQTLGELLETQVKAWESYCGREG